MSSTNVGVEPVHKTARFDLVLVAEDSKFMRELTANLLRKRNIASDVKSFENGLKLVSGFKDAFEEGRRVDAAIVDIHMPRMDGITAARVLRKIEIENAIPPVTFIFFSAVKSDAKLRQLMQAVAPAYYVNKGNDQDPQELARRISQLFYTVFGSA